MRFHVYILASHSRTLYVGVTRDLRRRVYQHRHPMRADSFTAWYRVSRLVHYEETENVTAAIAREKQIKGIRRQRKIELIERTNPGWHDLAMDWLHEHG